MSIVNVISASRSYNNRVVVCLELAGTTEITTFGYDDGNLVPSPEFENKLFGTGLTMADIESDIIDQLMHGTSRSAICEDDLYDTVDAIEERQYRKWQDAEHNEPHWY